VLHDQRHDEGKRVSDAQPTIRPKKVPEKIASFFRDEMMSTQTISTPRLSDMATSQ